MLKGAVVRTIEQENVPQKTSEQDGPAQGFREEKRDVLCPKGFARRSAMCPAQGVCNEERNRHSRLRAAKERVRQGHDGEVLKRHDGESTKWEALKLGPVSHWRWSTVRNS